MLRNYIYSDKQRLEMFFEQIASLKPRAKRIKRTVGVSLTGPKVEATVEPIEPVLTTHDKIELLIKYLKENNLLDVGRPKELYERGIVRPFVLETMNARKVIIPEERLRQLPGLKHLAVWISDPDPSDYVSIDYVWRGTFIYLTEAWLDNAAYGTVYSGCSALQAIANAMEGKPLIDRPIGPFEPLGRGNSDHPIQKLERLGAMQGDVRRITALYFKRYFTNEQHYTFNGGQRRVNDLLGYPIFIAEQV